MFEKLFDIGFANRRGDAVDWAEAQTLDIVRSQEHLIGSWMKYACDGFANDQDDLWQAPRLARMELLENAPAKKITEALAAWERLSIDETVKLREVMAQRYVLNLAASLEDIAVTASLKMAMEGVTVRSSTSPSMPLKTAAQPSNQKVKRSKDQPRHDLM